MWPLEISGVSAAYVAAIQSEMGVFNAESNTLEREQRERIRFWLQRDGCHSSRRTPRFDSIETIKKGDTS